MLENMSKTQPKIDYAVNSLSISDNIACDLTPYSSFSDTTLSMTQEINSRFIILSK